MIPTVTQAKELWKRYNLPLQKQRHVMLVAQVSRILADAIEKHTGERIQKDLLFVAALLHDIDKNMPHLPGEMHPDTAVRVLNEFGYGEVAKLVKTHPLHAILDERIAPRTWEEKLLFLADKMTKYEVIPVDERFSLWNQEHLPVRQQQILDAAYPKVKLLEEEILHVAHVSEEEVINMSKNSILE